MGTAEDQFHKTAGTAPAGQGDYCTYMEVQGIYTVPVGLRSYIYYRIFLGANNTDDYNLRRNTHYTVNTTIKGQSRSDTRITTRTPKNYWDYTDNDSPMFVASLRDSDNPMYWDAAQTYCAPGWRTPTHEEMMSMWIFKNGLGGFPAKDLCTYWTNTEVAGSPNYAWRENMLDGTTDGDIKTKGSYYVRCIRSDNYVQSGVRYPYVTSAGSTSGQASVIVSRDAAGGVKTACIHPNWTASTMPADYAESATANAFSARFEVAAADLPEQMNWADALTGCAGYTQAGTSPGDWRVPTQRELILIWVMRPSIDLSFTSFRYWSSTKSTKVINKLLYAWGMNFSFGTVEQWQKLALTCNVRCVRDF